MGLFQQRPEDPTEWAGLPAEPWEPASPASQLTDDTAPPLLGDIRGTETVAITIELDDGDD